MLIFKLNYFTKTILKSTLGFDCVEDKDNLVVIIAPPPDDEEGLEIMENLLNPNDPKKRISQPIVVLNYHMFPVENLSPTFEVAYHLRMLSVSFMASGDEALNREDEALPFSQSRSESIKKEQDANIDNSQSSVGIVEVKPSATNVTNLVQQEEEVFSTPTQTTNQSSADSFDDDDDAELEAAMVHANDLAHNQDHGMHAGTTRAMVIRGYPRPWHVFVDLAPDEDVDFEVAATFDEEPSPDDVHSSIIECIEGSEIEEELVAQQMQAALEAGQLEKVSERLKSFGTYETDEDNENEEEDEMESSTEKVIEENDEDESDTGKDVEQNTEDDKQ